MPGNDATPGEFYGRFPYPPAGAGRMWKKRRKSLHAEGGRIASMLASRNPKAAGGRVLDAGCGTGIKLVGLAKALPTTRILGVDASSASLEAAREAAAGEGAGNVELRLFDLENAQESDSLGRFDAVVCDGVIHHLRDPEPAIKRLAGLLNPGGVIYISAFSRIGRPAESRMREILASLPGGTGAAGDGLALARALLRLPGMVSERHATYYEDDAFLADAFLNPIEHHFDIPSLRRMLDGCGVEFETWPQGEKHVPELCSALASAGIDASAIDRRDLLALVEIWKSPAMISAFGIRK